LNLRPLVMSPPSPVQPSQLVSHVPSSRGRRSRTVSHCPRHPSASHRVLTRCQQIGVRGSRINARACVLRLWWACLRSRHRVPRRRPRRGAARWAQRTSRETAADAGRRLAALWIRRASAEPLGDGRLLLPQAAGRGRENGRIRRCRRGPAGTAAVSPRATDTRSHWPPRALLHARRHAPRGRAATAR